MDIDEGSVEGRSLDEVEIPADTQEIRGNSILIQVRINRSRVFFLYGFEEQMYIIFLTWSIMVLRKR
jgi:hypothetical protein